MSAVLVAYASHYGQTRKIAERLADQLRGHGHQVDVADVRSRSGAPAPDGYDAVVLGSRVEMGRHAPEIRRYIQAHRAQLVARPTAFFSVSMASSEVGAGVDPSGYMQALFEDVSWEPSLQLAVAGGLPYRKYGWLMRQIMKRISRSAGHPTDTSRNYELTDWASVRRFADRVDLLIRAHRVRPQGEAPPPL